MHSCDNHKHTINDEFKHLHVVQGQFLICANFIKIIMLNISLWCKYIISVGQKILNNAFHSSSSLHLLSSKNLVISLTQMSIFSFFM